MAQGRQEIVLVGYSEYLERRPLKFVEPIPAAIICSACGSVTRLTYYLLCGHTLCEPCYESCATTSKCVCPLDGDVCDTVDVSSKKYPAEKLLRRKVHCWNESNGCRAVLPASQVAEHVRRDCQHHVTRCPTCLAAVLCRDVCEHLKSRCTALALQAAPEPQQGTDNHDKALLVAFERKVEQRVRELDAKFAQLSLETGSQNDKLIALCHTVNHLKDAITEQFGPASVETLDRLNRNAAEMQALYSEQGESLKTVITSVLTSVLTGSKMDRLLITGYAALKEKTLKEGWASIMSDKVYLRGYLMSWGIRFTKVADSVYLMMVLHLHKGRNDEYLEWPFTRDLKLSIIHRETQQERILHEKPRVTEYTKDCFWKPTGGSNTAICFEKTTVESSDIERDGYVKADQLLLRFEVLL